VEALVEEVDIFPSLVELAGFPVPEELMGASWVPLLRPDPSPGAGKDVVFSQYPRYSQAHKTQVMGYSMRTHQYRFTEWIPFQCDIQHPMETCPTAESAAPEWDRGVIGTELYDHRNDTSTTFGDFENVNLAYEPEHRATVQALRHRLRAHWPKLQV
jgi:iduronate 2-sulfatase